MSSLNLLLKPASNLCNLSCRYCFYKDVSRFQSAGPSLMEESTLEAVVKKAFGYADESCTFGFQGGEPTLAGLSFYQKLIELENRYNTRKIPVVNTIQTNGILLDEDWCRFFKKHHFLVGLSLDGTEEMHDENRTDSDGSGTFQSVLHASVLLKKHQVDFNILCVVHSENVHAGKELYRFFAENGFRYLQFIPCIDNFDSEKNPFSVTAEEYGHFLNDLFSCYYRDFLSGNYVSIRLFDNYIGMLLGDYPEECALAGHCSVNYVIESGGNVYPCDFYAVDDYLLGNIREEDFDALSMQTAAADFVSDSFVLPEKCAACRWKKICRGGCRRDREQSLHGPVGENRFCSSYQFFFQKNEEKMLHMYRLLQTSRPGS